MTPLFIDIGIIGIIVFCAWRGFHNGLIRGAFGIVTLIVSLFIANTIARTYADEFTGVLTPFASGIVESTFFGTADEEEDIDLDLEGVDLDGVDLSGIDLSDIDLSELDLEDFDFGDVDLGDLDLSEVDLDDIALGDIETVPERFLAAYLALRQLGLIDSAATHVAQLSSEDRSGRFLPEVIGDNLALNFSYIALFGIAFLLSSIVFAVIGNLISFVFTLPGLRLVDRIAGVGLGFVKGLIIILAIGVVVRYFGVIFHETINETAILRHIANNNMLADILGV
jgi:uncharacterized membrane protein required for colicin V production